MEKPHAIYSYVKQCIKTQIGTTENIYKVNKWPLALLSIIFMARNIFRHFTPKKMNENFSKNCKKRNRLYMKLEYNQYQYRS